MVFHAEQSLVAVAASASQGTLLLCKKAQDDPDMVGKLLLFCKWLEDTASAHDVCGPAHPWVTPHLVREVLWSSLGYELESVSLDRIQRGDWGSGRGSVV